jgi:hypothetical protein
LIFAPKNLNLHCKFVGALETGFQFNVVDEYLGCLYTDIIQ